MEQYSEINRITDHLFRENSGRMISVLTRIFGLHQIDTATDIVQDTFEDAMKQWRFSGLPANPSAWLMQVAKNKAVNQFKRNGKMFQLSSFTDGYDQSVEPAIENFFLPHEIEDSQLRLLFMCCNSECSEKSQVILTLHAVCGFGITEISRALIMEEEAVKKVLYRTKNELKAKRDAFLASSLLQSVKRIETVRTVLYLMFNEGYKTTKGKDPINRDLVFESVRIGKLLLKLDPSSVPETSALLSLMFFNMARFSSRRSTEGNIIALDKQDRSAWNMVFIKEAYYYLNQSRKNDQLSRYHLEAGIASFHCSAKSFEETDWKSIVFLYEQLEKLDPSPLLRVSKAVALSYLHDPERGLLELKSIDAYPLQNYYVYHAAIGDMYSRAGEYALAVTEFRKALLLVVSQADREFIFSRIQRYSTINQSYHN